MHRSCSVVVVPVRVDVGAAQALVLGAHRDHRLLARHRTVVSLARSHDPSSSDGGFRFSSCSSSFTDRGTTPGGLDGCGSGSDLDISASFAGSGSGNESSATYDTSPSSDASPVRLAGSAVGIVAGVASGVSSSVGIGRYASATRIWPVGDSSVSVPRRLRLELGLDASSPVPGTTPRHGE